MERITLFADVILPLPIPGFFTYRVPYELNDVLQTGVRVVVQFGKKKIYTALVYKIHQNVPKGYIPKYILSILDDSPIVNEIQYKFWNWIATYYMCRIGEVMHVALPSSLKLASESCVVLNPEFEKDYRLLSDKEFLIAEALDIRQKLTLTEISDIVEQQKIIPLIKTMIEKKILLPEEELHNKFRPKKEICVRITPQYEDEKALHQLLDTLDRKAKMQMQLMMAYLHITRNTKPAPKNLSRFDLLAKAETAVAQLNTLVKKGVFETYEITQSRLKDYDSIAEVDSIILNENQSQAVDQIRELFKTKDVVLLHGITSSGKTEIYIKLINETIAQNKQVLFLLPEIALTTQIINRLRKYFGKQVGVYHSKYNNNERVEVWNKILPENTTESVGQPYKIVLGARSSLFLPYHNLGLVIVDEEHDTSYKQTEPAPRYNARDAAIYLAHLHGAKTLLGSATPSIETYFNTLNARFGLVELNKRFGDMELPEIIVADLKEQTRHKKMKAFFSETLFSLTTEALKNKEQVILFQNRRGFSTRVECGDCSWVPTCKYCDVTLIYHKHINQLKCHYCGYSAQVPSECPACKSTKILTKGFGTERIEEETELLFSETNIVRMDLDSTRTKNAYQQIINDFEDRKTQILIGTQMVTKGLDFENVSLVGILNADNMLSFPDFRAHERGYQMIAQVSGRAGRKNKRGKVVIQTYNPNNPIIKQALQNNYHAMCNEQLHQRKRFDYPPFSRLIQITLKHQDPNLLNTAAAYLVHNLRFLFGKKVFGPEYPIVSRIKNRYLKNVLIKLNRDAFLQKHKYDVESIIKEFSKVYPAVQVSLDVDPL
ncbi:MAG: primosomal protein N' [Bacteroidota bacterium]